MRSEAATARPAVEREHGRPGRASPPSRGAVDLGCRQGTALAPRSAPRRFWASRPCGHEWQVEQSERACPERDVAQPYSPKEERREHDWQQLGCDRKRVRHSGQCRAPPRDPVRAERSIQKMPRPLHVPVVCDLQNQPAVLRRIRRRATLLRPVTRSQCKTMKLVAMSSRGEHRFHHSRSLRQQPPSSGRRVGRQADMACGHGGWKFPHRVRGVGVGERGVRGNDRVRVVPETLARPS